MKVSIVYVNYNTTGLLVDSLRSLKKLDGIFDYEVIVVDNATKDFDPAPIMAAYPKARIIESKENLGFGKGNNLGAREAKGEYIWLLNTDAFVPEGHHLERLIEFMDKNTDYGAALPMLSDDQNTIQPAQVAYFPTPAKILLNIPLRLVARFMPSLKQVAGRVNYDYRELATGDVEVAVAAALFVRRSVFEKVRGFSPEFFMFYEDSDLCRKIWNSGYKIRFMTESKVVHLWGQSISGKRSFLRRKKLYFHSQDVYLRKWHSWPAMMAVKSLRWPLMVKYWLFNH